MTDFTHIWFVGFWALIVTLCVVEWMRPAFQGKADRAGRWPANFGLGLLNGFVASIVPSLSVLVAIWAADNGFGLLNLAEFPMWFSAVVTVVVLSFAQYAFHRLTHRYEPLWRIHQVHHSDVHLDASSALRFHPLELAATALFVIPFIAVAGLPAKVTAIYEATQIVVGLITHANIDMPDFIERHARSLFITPVLHRFHHSGESNETHLNFGNVFSVWDRIFGTLHSNDTSQIRGPKSFGLCDHKATKIPDLFSLILLKRDHRDQKR